MLNQASGDNEVELICSLFRGVSSLPRAILEVTRVKCRKREVRSK